MLSAEGLQQCLCRVGNFPSFDSLQASQTETHFNTHVSQTRIETTGAPHNLWSEVLKNGSGERSLESVPRLKSSCIFDFHVFCVAHVH